jgi:hypothetical protein
MKHPALRWNPELQEWFCVRCGLTSDCGKQEDAEAELDFLFECEIPIGMDGQPEQDEKK